jgi:hypothetical protein
MSAREANELLNDYVGDARRGICVFHDHFVGRHGGVVVVDVQTDEEAALLDDPGPLGGWELAVHPLTFALTTTGFVAQTRFTVERYRGTTLERVAEQEEADPRYWWRGDA